MKLLAILAIGTILSACNNTKEVIESTPEVAKKATIGDVMQDSDPVTINGVKIKGNILTIDVEYSGGCTDHVFELVGSESLMKSMPPKRPMKLVHKSNGETCRMVITESWDFDLKDLAYVQTSGSEIKLLLDGYKEEISYVYP